MSTKKQKKVNKLDHTNLLLIALIVVSLGITAKYIWFPIIKNTSIYNEVYKVYQANRWVTFTSERAKFSFSHPLDWPIAVVSDEDISIHNRPPIGSSVLKDIQMIEDIRFSKEWIPNDNSQGGFTVDRVKNINTLEDYVKSIDKETSIYSPRVVGGKVTFPAPEISNLTIGGEKAIAVKEKIDTISTFSFPSKNYYVVKNGRLYRFYSSYDITYQGDRRKHDETFQKIISTIKFLD